MAQLPHRADRRGTRARVPRCARPGTGLPLQPTIQDLERYAPEWASSFRTTMPSSAPLARMLGEKYRCRTRQTPDIAPGARASTSPARRAGVRAAARPAARHQSTPTDSPGASDCAGCAAAAAHRLETLPPFWTAFALTLTETVGAGILALPIALAEIGPLAGLIVICRSRAGQHADDRGDGGGGRPQRQRALRPGLFRPARGRLPRAACRAGSSTPAS